ncbi:MAG: molecular chaperone HtpG [Thiotrichales bacterium]
MSVEPNKENLNFQTEVNQLLHLMIHSLYSNKEIFLRELISNASDACDKLRFEALGNNDLYEQDSELRVEVEFDKDAKTITIRDNGIGMSRDEVVEHIGTIAKSGTAEFLKAMNKEQSDQAHLIGQFGVGFYSSFIVAERVELYTRRAGLPPEQGVRWESSGENGFAIESVERSHHGTEVILHLRQEEQDDLLNRWRLKSIIGKYSDHVPLPIRMREEDENGKPTDNWEVVNRASALWTRAKSEVSDDEYTEFYKHVAHDFEAPLAWTHNRVEGKQEYISLLYIPARAPFDLWERDQVHGVKLYVQRVFIMDDAKTLMPRYLRFVRGVIDSSDLPLNVSREILQHNRQIDSIRSGSVKKVLALLEGMAKNEPEQYAKFWEQFGKVMKEGAAEDFANRDQVLKLLRFASTHADTDAQTATLEDYVGRMKDGQKKIYYITADSFTAAKRSPHLEIFRKQGIEVLLMHDRVDEWLMSYVHEFDGKPFQSVAKGDLDLGEIKGDDQAVPELDDNDKSLLERLQSTLGERVEKVQRSERLTDSPSCIVMHEHDMALYMQHLMKQAGQALPSSKPILEVNLGHPILRKLQHEKDEQRLNEWAGLLLDQAILAEGGQLEDPAGFVSRMNDIILTLSEAA